MGTNDDTGKRTAQVTTLQRSDSAPSEARSAGIALSGGGSWGAFTAGIIHAAFSRFLDRGTIPRLTVIAGTSTGSLVGALLAQFYGAYKIGPSEKARAVLEELERVYTETEQSEVGERPNSLLGTAWNLATKKGVMDISPLRKLIDRMFDARLIAAARAGAQPVEYVCNYTNMVTGRTQRMATDDLPSRALFCDAIFASCAQPVVMTPAFVRDEWATDGGVREVIPIREVMSRGCTAVMTIALNEPVIDPEQEFTRGTMKDPMRMIARGLHVMNDEVARDDERLAYVTAYLNRAQDELRAAGVSDATMSKAFPGGMLPVTAEGPDVPKDAYGNDVYNQSKLRDILLLRFAEEVLPEQEAFDPPTLSKLFRKGVKLAEEQAEEIDRVLRVGGDLDPPAPR